jgi:hypothetical protein
MRTAYLKNSCPCRVSMRTQAKKLCCLLTYWTVLQARRLYTVQLHAASRYTLTLTVSTEYAADLLGSLLTE